MRSRVLGAISAILLSAVGGAAVARADDDLGTRLDAALAVRALRGAHIAALVVDRDSGRTLFARNPDRALVPASNLKLLTAAAALNALGPTHRFVTQLLSDAPPDADGAIGNLYVRGGGDPALTSEDFWRLAADRDAHRLELHAQHRARVARRIEHAAHVGLRFTSGRRDARDDHLLG
ncbi:MAG TPA: D-alanyl-D-alanine carboxypeptidase, partial [Myxococcota bacterium]